MTPLGLFPISLAAAEWHRQMLALASNPENATPGRIRRLQEIEAQLDELWEYRRRALASWFARSFGDDVRVPVPTPASDGYHLSYRQFQRAALS